ncbi:MAG TPA: hypothetical protein DC009_05255, partial [Porphyromonadaceae bacterium]|nr:hypothetical protein [Porphyromonadaceae bacterium]
DKRFLALTNFRYVIVQVIQVMDSHQLNRRELDSELIKLVSPVQHVKFRQKPFPERLENAKLQTRSFQTFYCDIINIVAVYPDLFLINDEGKPYAEVALQLRRPACKAHGDAVFKFAQASVEQMRVGH